jgi:hypothetical protein
VLTRKQIAAALPQVADGLRKYLSLSRQLRRPRFHADPGFQKAFNYFYRVRRSRSCEQYGSRTDHRGYSCAVLQPPAGSSRRESGAPRNRLTAATPAMTNMSSTMP